MKIKNLRVGILVSLAVLIFIAVYYFKSKNMQLGASVSESLNSNMANKSNVGTGCLFDKDKLQKEAVFTYSVKDNENGNSMLSNYSLEDYLPEIGDQGDVGSCVGWSTTYYGFTIVKRIEHGKNYPAFSPLSVFNRFSYQNGTDPCRGGAWIDGCLGVLVNKGCPYQKDYDKPYCCVDASKQKYKDCLSGYERLQSNNPMQLKLALLNNNPVIIGMNVFAGGKGNALNSKFLDSNGVVRMENFRNNSYRAGGHALCVIGYDDNISGGAFKIANSWGKDWGKQGFFWLRYSDLDVVMCAYSLLTNDMAANKEALFKTHYLSIENNTKKDMYLSLGLKTKDGNNSKGWYYLKAGNSKNIDISTRTGNNIYYLIMDEKGNIKENKSSSTKFATKKSFCFDLDDNSEQTTVTNYAYYNYTPSNRKKIEKLRINSSSNPKISK